MYYKDFMETVTQTEQICNEELLKLETVHPMDLVLNKEEVINEAILSKDTINNAMNTLYSKLIKLTVKAVQVATTLKKKNEDWMKSTEEFLRTNPDVKLENYEMFDYKTGIRRMEETRIPVFLSVAPEDFSNDGETFKEKAFKEIYTAQETTNNNDNKKENSSNSPTAYFRGSTEKKTYNKNELIELAKFGHNWMKNYVEFVKKFANDGNNIASIFKTELKVKEVPITESTLLHSSIFRDEYFDLLLEEGVDPTDLEKEEKTPIESNKEENSASDMNKEKSKNAEIYAKICAAVVMAKYSVCSEAYKAFVDLIDKLSGNKFGGNADGDK